MDFTPAASLPEDLGRAGRERQRSSALNHDLVSAWPTKRRGIPAFLENSADGKKNVLDGFAVHGSDFYCVPNHTVRTVLNEVAQSAAPSRHCAPCARMDVLGGREHD